MTDINTTLLANLVAQTQANSFMWLAATDYQPLVDAGYAETNATVPGAPEGQLATRATPAGIAYSANPASPADTTSGFGTAPQTANAPAADGVTDANAVNASAVSSFTPAPAASVAPTGEKKAAFVAINDFQPPASKARTRVATGADEKYDFAGLAAPTKNEDGSYSYAGASIFVPATAHTKGDKKGQLRTAEEMAFSLVSACSAANRRYATVSGTKTGADGKTRKSYEYTREFKSAPWTMADGTVGAVIYRFK